MRAGVGCKSAIQYLWASMWLGFLVLKSAPIPATGKQGANCGLVATFTYSLNCQKNTKDTDTYSKLQHIHKQRGALSTNNSKKTQVKETTASKEGGAVGMPSTQKDVVESTSIVGTILAINLRKTTK